MFNSISMIINKNYMGRRLVWMFFEQAILLCLLFKHIYLASFKIQKPTLHASNLF